MAATRTSSGSRLQPPEFKEPEAWSPLPQIEPEQCEALKANRLVKVSHWLTAYDQLKRKLGEVFAARPAAAAAGAAAACGD